MIAFGQQLVDQLLATSLWEWLAVCMAVVYIGLAVRESVWCWPAAFISTAIYMVLFFDVNLYMESLLNVYYLVMAVYGFYQWRYKTEGEAVKPVIRWQLAKLLTWSTVMMSTVIIIAWLLTQYSNQDYAYIDTFTTFFALVATYMTVKKVLENWIFWFVIDSISVYLYIKKGFALSALLYFSYTIISVWGWIKWKQHYDQQSSA